MHEKTQYLNTIRKAGFKSVETLSESTYDIDVSPELRGKVTSIQVEAHKIWRRPSPSTRGT